MRADKLEFNISYSDSAYPDNASKLRVFCYMKNGGYAFGDEFENKYSATFDSNRTSKYSGYGTITIQLLDAEENLINSANVICKIIESNSTTPFVASPDFTEQSKLEVQAIVDDGKAQIVSATKEAKEEINSWTDQSYRIAKNESNIADLQLFKANTGALHFYSGGYLSCSGLANKQIPKENTIAFRWKCDAQTFSNMATNSCVVSYGSCYHIAKVSGDILQWYIKWEDAGDQYISLQSVTSLLTDGNWHNVAMVSSGTEFKLIVDGIVKITQAHKGAILSIPTGDFLISNSVKDKNNEDVNQNIGSIADVCYFNFDMSSEDAPYTIADYQQGKPIPAKAFYGQIQDGFVGGIGQKYSLFYNMPTNIIFDENGTTITLDNTNGQSGSYQVIAFEVKPPIPKGAYLTVEGVWSNIFSVDAYNNSTKIGGIFTYGVGITPLTLSADCTALRIRPIAPVVGSTKTITLPPSCKIKVNGAILALEDYTITNGNSRIVFDYSGNNNDATITGNVNGDNDNRVQKLINFIKS